jgi:hypothetical protein
MLGMKHLSRKNPELAWEKLCDLWKAKKETLGKPIEMTCNNKIISDRIKTIMFSDTIIIYSKCDEKEDLLAITCLCIQLFGDALKRCVPLRGGIAHGIFRTNIECDLYAGPALVEAHDIGESAQWLGIVVDDVVAERCMEIPCQSGGKDIIISWQLPLKCGRRLPKNVVNWALSMRDGFSDPPPYSVEQYYKGFVQTWGAYSTLDENAKKKHQNTVEFVNYCLASEYQNYLIKDNECTVTM